jgi:hypothetical protein
MLERFPDWHIATTGLSVGTSLILSLSWSSGISIDPSM